MPKMPKMQKQPVGKYNTNGGNGGYSRKQKVDAGFSAPLKTTRLTDLAKPVLTKIK